VLLGLLGACASHPDVAPIPVPIAVAPPASAQSPDAPVLRIEAGMHTAPIIRMDVDAQERFLVTASHDKTARVWDLANGELLQILRPPLGPDIEGKLYAVAISPDGATVAVAGWTPSPELDSEDIYLFDRASGRMQRRLTGLPNVVNHLAYSPDGRYLVAATLGNGGIRVYETRHYSEVARDSDCSAESYWAEFDRSGRLVTSCYDGYIRLYDASLQRIAKRKAPGGTRPFAVSFSPDGTSVAVGFDDTTAVNVLSGEDLALLYTPDTKGVDNRDLAIVDWARDGLLLYASGGYHDGSGICPILQWSQAGRGPVTTRLAAATDTVMDLRVLADGRLVFVAADPALRVFAANGARLWAGEPSTVDFRGRQTELRVSRDGLLVESGFNVLMPANRFDYHLVRLQLTEGRLLFDPESLAALEPPHTTGLPISDWKNSDTPRLNGTPLPLKQYEFSHTLAIAPDKQRFLLGTEWYLRLFDRQGQQVWETPAPSDTRAVNITADNRLAVAAFGDGTLRWYRLSDGAELLALFIHPDRQRWVLWTPEGFFNASPGGETLIGYHLNQGADTAGEFVTVEQLYSLFYRPDLVARRLEDGIEPVLRAALARIGDVRQVLAAGLPPALELVSLAEQRQSVRDFELQFKISPKNGGVGRIVYRVNGIVREDLGARPGDIALPFHRRPFTLEPGRNIISATVFNANNTVESTPIETVVHVEAEARRPALYVLAVGITNYRDSALQLHYAASDAQEVVQTLQRRGQGLFTSVSVTPLLDGDATLRGIDAAFQDLAARVQEHDVFVLHLAGHGMTIDGVYYFIPWDMVYTNQQALQSGSVHQDRLAQWLGLIKAQKSFVVLDTCHSGAFVTAAPGMLPTLASTRGLEEKGAIDRLMRATGRAVLAAATARQFALEGYEGHGVLTHVLLQGLGGKAADRDGLITVNELITYVSSEVPRLTMAKWGYEQFPMHQSQGQPFAIGRIRP